jgi:hypothetical protein
MGDQMGQDSLFKQQGKEHQKGVHFISPVLMKSSMK